jgi:predicted nucleotide-binding protein
MEICIGHETLALRKADECGEIVILNVRKERPMVKRTTMRRPVVFVGSSSEGLDIAENVQLNLDASADVELWTQGVFGLTQDNPEALVQASSKFDFAILVLTEDDILISRGNQRQTARDNVLFELGLFLGKIGRDRTFIVCDRDHSPYPAIGSGRNQSSDISAT